MTENIEALLKKQAVKSFALVNLQNRSSQLRAAIQQMQERNYDTGVIREARRDGLLALKESYVTDIEQEREQIAGKIAAAGEQWEAEREKHPEREMLKLRRLEIKYGGLDREGAKKAFQDIVQQKYRPGVEEVDLLIGKLDDTDAQSLRSMAEKENFRSPWKSAPEVAELATYGEILESANDKNVILALRNDKGNIAAADVKIDDFIKD